MKFRLLFLLAVCPVFLFSVCKKQNGPTDIDPPGTDTTATAFFVGADLSYVNEMEGCGVVYREKGVAKDPYRIFADNGCNLVRLRLWHTPSWYDTLNGGKRYSDFSDVRRSIELLASGELVLPKVVGDVIPLSEVRNGLDRVHTGDTGGSRIVVDITA